MFDALSADALCDTSPDQDNSLISQENLRLIAEVGVTALTLGRGESAEPIFDLIDQTQPDNAAGALCLALCDLSAGRVEVAIDRLRAAIRDRKRCVRESKAALCVILKQVGRQAEAQELRLELMRGPDCGAKRMVAAMWR